MIHIKTKLPEAITTVEEAKQLLTDLHNNLESYHPEDDASDCIGHLATEDECNLLNKLMDDIYALNGTDNPHLCPVFDPCDFLLNIVDKDGVNQFAALNQVAEPDLKTKIIALLEEYIDKDEQDVTSGIDESIYDAEDNVENLQAMSDARKLLEEFKKQEVRTPPHTDEDNGIYKYLDCSTGHITIYDNDFLAGGGVEGDGLIIRPHECGYWLHVVSNDDLEEAEEVLQTLSPSLQAVLRKAQRLDCNWVNLDRDGCEHDDLPKYEWKYDEIAKPDFEWGRDGDGGE